MATPQWLSDIGTIADDIRQIGAAYDVLTSDTPVVVTTSTPPIQPSGSSNVPAPPAATAGGISTNTLLIGAAVAVALYLLAKQG